MATGIRRSSESIQADIKIVLLGLKESGKSSTGNTILGWKRFTETPDSSSDIESDEIQFGQARVTVVDAPGLCPNSEVDLQDRLEEIITYLRREAEPSPYVFCFVLTTDIIKTFTKEDGETIALMRQTFGNAVMRHAILLFTHGDDLKTDGVKIDDLLNQAPDELRTLESSCRGRVFVINNHSSDANSEARRLFDSISKWKLDQKDFVFSNEKSDEEDSEEEDEENSENKSEDDQDSEDDQGSENDNDEGGNSEKSEGDDSTHNDENKTDNEVDDEDQDESNDEANNEDNASDQED